MQCCIVVTLLLSFCFLFLSDYCRDPCCVQCFALWILGPVELLWLPSSRYGKPINDSPGFGGSRRLMPLWVRICLLCVCSFSNVRTYREVHGWYCVSVFNTVSCCCCSCCRNDETNKRRWILWHVVDHRFYANQVVMTVNDRSFCHYDKSLADTMTSPLRNRLLSPNKTVRYKKLNSNDFPTSLIGSSSDFQL